MAAAHSVEQRNLGRSASGILAQDSACRRRLAREFLREDHRRAGESGGVADGSAGSFDEAVLTRARPLDLAGRNDVVLGFKRQDRERARAVVQDQLLRPAYGLTVVDEHHIPARDADVGEQPALRGRSDRRDGQGERQGVDRIPADPDHRDVPQRVDLPLD